RCRMPRTRVCVRRRARGGAVDDVLSPVDLVDRRDALDTGLDFYFPQLFPGVHVQRTDRAIACPGENQSSCDHDGPDLREMTAGVREPFGREFGNLSERNFPSNLSAVQIVSRQ